MENDVTIGFKIKLAHLLETFQGLWDAVCLVVLGTKLSSVVLLVCLWLTTWIIQTPICSHFLCILTPGGMISLCILSVYVESNSGPPWCSFGYPQRL
jgi:hypothetical protein